MRNRSPLIRPSATFSLREKGSSGELELITIIYETINLKRQFMNHRATEQLRNQTVTSTTGVTKMVYVFSWF